MGPQQDDFNRGGMVAFIFTMVFSVVFFIYISFLHPGVDLKETAPAETPETQDAPATSGGESGSLGSSEPREFATKM